MLQIKYDEKSLENCKEDPSMMEKEGNLNSKLTRTRLVSRIKRIQKPLKGKLRYRRNQMTQTQRCRRYHAIKSLSWYSTHTWWGNASPSSARTTHGEPIKEEDASIQVRVTKSLTNTTVRNLFNRQVPPRTSFN